MSNTVVLITGALSGIGRATAVAYARENTRLVVSGRNESRGQELARELRSLGSEVEYINANVRVDEEVRRLVDNTVARFGRLDVAVNNAGTEGTPGPLLELDTVTYQNTFDTNVLGVALSMKHEIRVMLPQRHGSIVNVSSGFGKVGGALASIYVASKHAVEGLTKSAALELAGTGIRVNAVAPGPIETAMFNRFTGGSSEAKAAFLDTVPVKRAGTPEEIANAIRFLGSEQSSYVVGASLSVDGGITTG